MGTRNEITEPSNLLDEKGNLIQKGWAKKMILNRNIENVKAGKLRIKDWDCYEVINEDFCLVLIIADVGYFGMGTISFKDFKNKTKKDAQVNKLFSKGALNMPPTSNSGDLIFSKNQMTISFEIKENNRILTFDYPEFDNGKGINGKITLFQDPNMDTIVNVVPFKKKKHFVFAQKIIGMPANGSFSIGDEKYEVSEKNSSYGVIDWSRGVFPYKTTWYWGSAFGKINGDTLGFNIDYGFGDETVASKNMLFFNNKGHKIGHVTFHIDKKDVMKPWKFTSSDGRFEMVLDPIFDSRENLNLVILKNVGSQVFGYFTGDVILDNGKKIHVDRMFGFAEKFFHRW
ncbi:MAG: DUF2804 domain-containing protein [Promethearchaeota archaeon]